MIEQAVDWLLNGGVETIWVIGISWAVYSLLNDRYINRLETERKSKARRTA